MNPVASPGDGKEVVFHAITRPNQQQLSGEASENPRSAGVPPQPPCSSEPHGHLSLHSIELDLYPSRPQLLVACVPLPDTPPWSGGKGQILTLFTVLPTEAERTVTQVRVPPVHTGAPVLAGDPIAEVPLRSTACRAEGIVWP